MLVKPGAKACRLLIAAVIWWPRARSRAMPAAMCLCNQDPACRHNHHIKQVPGWTVTCRRPGILTWTTSGHRSHTTTPAEYLG